MKILIIGGGGREHAMARAISASKKCTHLFAAPGNPGIAEFATCLNLPIDVLDICTSIYSKNPRRVIDFLNKIQIEKYLVELQEEQKNFVSGKLSQNISGLAKLLAIKEEWTDLHDRIEKNIDFF